MFSHRVVGLIPVLLLCVAILLPDESMASCDFQALPKCVTTKNTTVPTVITSESLQNHCRIAEEAIACVRNAGCHEDPNIRLIYQGLNATFNAICRTLRNEYLSHANCYESSEVKEAETLCARQESNTDTTLTDCDCLKLSIHNIHNAEEFLDLWSYRKKSLTVSCVVRSVDSCCGAEAAQLYATLTKTIFGPAAASSGCQLQTHLEVAVPLVCVSTVPEETTTRLEYTTSQLTSGVHFHHNNNRIYLAFIGVSMHIRLLFQTYN